MYKIYQTKLSEVDMKNDKKIRKKSLIALDIGTDNIKLAVGRFANNKVTIKNYITLKTPEHAISNGRIKDSAKIVEVLITGMKEHDIKAGYSVVNVKSSSIINRELTLPYSDVKEALDKIVYFEMKQFLAIKMDQYVIQYQIIEEFYEDKVRMIKVIVTLIEKEVVESYLTLIKEIGLKPYVFDVHFNTIGKVFWLYNEAVDFVEKTVAVVDIGYNSTDVTIVVNGQFKLSRTIDAGSNTLVYMLLEEFNYDLHEKHNSYKIFNANLPQIEERVKQTLNVLVEEINNVIRFYMSRDAKNKVDNIYFTGGIANYDDVTTHLEHALQIEKFQFRNLQGMLQGLDKKEDLSSYFTLVGAFIRR